MHAKCCWTPSFPEVDCLHGQLQVPLQFLDWSPGQQALTGLHAAPWHSPEADCCSAGLRIATCLMAECLKWPAKTCEAHQWTARLALGGVNSVGHVEHDRLCLLQSMLQVRSIKPCSDALKCAGGVLALADSHASLLRCKDERSCREGNIPKYCGHEPLCTESAVCHDIDGLRLRQPLAFWAGMSGINVYVPCRDI